MKKVTSKTTSKSYALRIDGPLVKPLQELKKQNRRSLNAEINAALEAWVAIARGQKSPAAKVASSSKSPKVSRTEPVEVDAAQPTSGQAAAAQSEASQAGASQTDSAQTDSVSSQPRTRKPSKRKTANAAPQAEATPDPVAAPESPASVS
jgi:hypothetical protein